MNWEGTRSEFKARLKALWLMQREHLFWNNSTEIGLYGDTLHPLIICNDAYMWGYSDCEKAEWNDIHILYYLHKKYPEYIWINHIWAAYKRNDFELQHAIVRQESWQTQLNIILPIIKQYYNGELKLLSVSHSEPKWEGLFGYGMVYRKLFKRVRTITSIFLHNDMWFYMEDEDENKIGKITFYEKRNRMFLPDHFEPEWIEKTYSLDQLKVMTNLVSRYGIFVMLPIHIFGLKLFQEDIDYFCQKSNINKCIVAGIWAELSESKYFR